MMFADFKSKGPLVTSSVLFAFSMAPMKSRPTRARLKEGSDGEDAGPNFSTSNTIIDRNLESETGKAKRYDSNRSNRSTSLVIISDIMVVEEGL
jgi:hypothetical protein